MAILVIVFVRERCTIAPPFLPGDIWAFRFIKDSAFVACACAVGTPVCLLFKKGASRAKIERRTRGRRITLRVCYCFAVCRTGQLDFRLRTIGSKWKRATFGNWEARPYFRDRDRHLVELRQPGTLVSLLRNCGESSFNNENIAVKKSQSRKWGTIETSRAQRLARKSSTRIQVSTLRLLDCLLSS